MASFGLQSNIRRYVDTLLDTINSKINDIYSQFNFIKIHSHKQIELLKNTLLTKIQNLALRITKVDNKFSMMEKAFDIPATYYSSYDIKNTGRSGPKKYNAILNINVLPEVYFPIVQQALVSNINGNDNTNVNIFTKYIGELIKNKNTTSADLLNTINNNQDQGEFIKKLFNNTIYFYHLITDTSYKLEFEKTTLNTPQTFYVNNNPLSVSDVYKLKYVDSDEPISYLGVSIQIPLIQQSNNQLMLLFYDNQINDKLNQDLERYLDKNNINKNIFSNNAISFGELSYLFNSQPIPTNVSVVSTGKDRNHVTISNLKSRVDIGNMDDIYIPATLLDSPINFNAKAPGNSASIKDRYDFIKNNITLKNDNGKNIPLKKYNINHPISEEQFVVPFSNVDKK